MEKPTTKDNITSYLFLLPFAFIFLTFLAYPIIYSLWLSFHKVTNLYDVFGGLQYIGLRNYITLLSDPEFWWAVAMTFYYAILSIPLNIIVSLILAILMHRGLKATNIYRTAFFMPYVLDIFVVAIVWTFIYSAPYGILPQLMGKIHSNLRGVNLLATPLASMPAIVLAMVLKGAGFGMVLFLAGLQNIPKSLYEAGEIDGATGFKKHIYITLPMLRPILLFMVVTGVVASLSAFAEFYGMTGGGPTISLGGQALGVTRVTGLYLFRAFENLKLGYAAATSFILLIFTIALSLIGVKLIKRK